MPRPALLRNLGTKILALAIAILVWFVFSAQQRERISERSYRIPLSVANVPAGTLIASPLPPTIEVRLRGPFTALRQLDPGKLEAVIDLTGAPRGERINRLDPEDINVPQEVEVIAIAPSEIRVALDAIAEKTLPIAARLAGSPAPGFEVGQVLVEPPVARLLGPDSSLSRMTSVQTDPVSLADRAADFSVPATVLADAPGVRVREGQVVTVTVRLRPAAPAQPSPGPGRKRSGT
jgi:YbbR domain-containing protein